MGCLLLTNHERMNSKIVTLYPTCSIPSTKAAMYEPEHPIPRENYMMKGISRSPFSSGFKMITELTTAGQNLNH